MLLKEEEKRDDAIINNSPTKVEHENYYNRDGYFRLMLKYEYVNGSPCEKVSWKEYDYEAYRHMTKEKRNWYLFWRSQVRSGVYLDTDFAYIHCYITEVVNGIGGLSAQQIYHTLEKIYFAYFSSTPSNPLSLSDLSLEFKSSLKNPELELVFLFKGEFSGIMESKLGKLKSLLFFLSSLRLKFFSLLLNLNKLNRFLRSLIAIKPK